MLITNIEHTFFRGECIMNQNPISLFFNNPAMWFWAIGMIAIISIGIVIFTPPMVSLGGLEYELFSGGGFNPYMDESSEGSSIMEYLGTHLLPYTLKFRIAGKDSTVLGISGSGFVTFYSDYTAGVFFLALCLLGIILITRRSSNVISILGPYWVYSIVIMFYLWKDFKGDVNEYFASDFSIHLLWLPCLFSLVITSLITALICRALGNYAQKRGLIAGIDDSDYDSIQVNSEILDNTSRFATNILETGSFNQISSPGTGGKKSTVKFVGRNIRCCPFCGSDHFSFVKPNPYGSQCKSCGRIVGAIQVDSERGNQCPVCNADLVDRAKFCHTCGFLLANQIEDTKLENNVQINHNRINPDDDGEIRNEVQNSFH